MNATTTRSLLLAAATKAITVRADEVGERFLLLGAREDDKVRNRELIHDRVKQYAKNINDIIERGDAIELIDNGDQTFSIVDGQNRLYGLAMAGATGTFLARIFRREDLNDKRHKHTWELMQARMVAGRNAARPSIAHMLQMHACDSIWPNIAEMSEISERFGTRDSRGSARVAWVRAVKAHVLVEEVRERGGFGFAYKPAGRSQQIVEAWTGADESAVETTLRGLAWWASEVLAHCGQHHAQMMRSTTCLAMAALLWESYSEEPDLLALVAARFVRAPMATLKDHLVSLRRGTRRLDIYAAGWMRLANQSARTRIVSLFGETGRTTP